MSKIITDMVASGLGFSQLDRHRSAAECLAQASRLEDAEHRAGRGRIDADEDSGPSVWAVIEEMLAYEHGGTSGPFPDEALNQFDEWREQLKAALGRMEKR